MCLIVHDLGTSTMRRPRPFKKCSDEGPQVWCSFLTHCGVSLAVVPSVSMLVVPNSSNNKGLRAMHQRRAHRLHEQLAAGPNGWEPSDWGRCGDTLQGNTWSKSARLSLTTWRRRRASQVQHHAAIEYSKIVDSGESYFNEHFDEG